MNKKCKLILNIAVPIISLSTTSTAVSCVDKETNSNQKDIIDALKLTPGIKQGNSEQQKEIIDALKLTPGIKQGNSEQQKEIIDALKLTPGIKNNNKDNTKPPLTEDRKLEPQNDRLNNRTKEIKNTNLGKFLEKEGVVKTLFLKDVKPNFSEFTHFIDENDEIDTWVYGHNNRDEGWFDINKEFGRGDNFLCGAIVVVNALHYWSIQNKEYLDKYLSIDDKKGVISFKNSTSDITIDFRNLNIFIERQGGDGIKTYRDDSKLFEWIKSDYGGEADKRTGKGFVTPFKLFDELINGYRYFRKGGKSQIQNNPRDWREDANWKGFFKDVFGSNILSNKYSFRNGSDAKYLSDKLKKEILSNTPLGISHTYGSVVVNHIINIWGADFDKDGILKAIYVTDSDDPFAKFKENGIEKRLAIKRYKVDFNAAKDKIYIGAKKNNETEALDIYTFGLGTSFWQDYFKKIDKKQ
ncbi:IdeS/Mac family cysteine endopeptidase [Mycoplasmopsis mucosicanis]|uniref:IdeS/Mac family cysteine endopeptidase n=1 Tax=Mycoplasmopsis mucosicanis TaxID=458208 RepID=UPI001EEA0281|nr:IdeS/Mac family cysteine endopeptidase [Mycoplasmopsis mucosicanis]